MLTSALLDIKLTCDRLENNVIIIAACLPTLKSLVTRPKSREPSIATNTRRGRGFIKDQSPFRSIARLQEAHIYSPIHLDKRPQSEMPEGLIRVTTVVERQTMHVDLAPPWPLPNTKLPAPEDDPLLKEKDKSDDKTSD